MKIKIILTSLIILSFTLASLGQQINVNKRNIDISNFKDRQLAIYFNNSFHPKNFVEKEDSIVKVFSNLAGYQVAILSGKEIRELRKINSKKYFVIEVQKVNEKWKSRCHACNKKREYSYYSFTIKLSEKNREIASFYTTSNSISDLDYITSFYVLNSLLDGVHQGVTWRNTNTFLNKNKTEVSKGTLAVSDDFANISLIESGCSFPKSMVKLSKAEIIEKLDLKSENFLYAYVCPVEDTAGKYFNTLIIDGQTQKVIGFYCWEKKL